MLYTEITPFSDATRELVAEAQDLIARVSNGKDVSSREMTEAIAKLGQVRRSIDRFEACAKDEWQMKERALVQVRTCRLNHRDK